MKEGNPTMASKTDEWKWKVESAANTLMEAERIKKDKKLLDAVRQELKRRKAELQSAAGKI